MSLEPYEAFRKYLFKLHEVLPDNSLGQLALELYSAGVVSRPKEKVEKLKLLFEVEDKLKDNPAKFQNLLQVFRNQQQLKEVTDELEAACKDCSTCMYK